MIGTLQTVDALVYCPACNKKLFTNTTSVPSTLCPLMTCRTCGAQFRIVSKLHTDILCDSCPLRIDCLGVERVKEIFRYVLSDGTVLEN